MDIRTLGVKGYSVSAAAYRRGDFSNLLKPVLEAPALRSEFKARLCYRVRSCLKTSKRSLGRGWAVKHLITVSFLLRMEICGLG